ncbi:unnamed protein product [Prunus armeniaca]
MALGGRCDRISHASSLSFLVDYHSRPFACDLSKSRQPAWEGMMILAQDSSLVLIPPAVPKARTWS